MTPVSVSLTTTGAARSAAVAVDNFTNPFNIGLIAVASGTVTYNIEISPQDPMDAGYTVSGANWAAPVLPSPLTVTGLTGSVAVPLTVPCRAVSINVTATTGSATVTLYLVQAGLR